MRRKKCVLVVFSLVFFCNGIQGENGERNTRAAGEEPSFLEWTKAGDSQDASPYLSSPTLGNFVGKRELVNSVPPQRSDAEGDGKLHRIEKANPKENELIPEESKINFIQAQNGPTLDPNPEPQQNPQSENGNDVVFRALGKDESEQADSTTQTSEKSDDNKKDEESEADSESVTIIDMIDTEVTSTTTTVAPLKAQSSESGEALLTWRSNPKPARRRSHNHNAQSSAVNRARIRNRMRDIYHAYFVKKERESRSHNSKNEDRCAHIQCKPPPEDADCEMEKTNIQIPIHSKFHTLQSCCPLWFCTSKVDGTFYTHYGMFSTKKVAHLSRRHKLNSRNHIHVPRTSTLADPVVSISEPAEKVAAEPQVDSDKHFEAKESTYYKYEENTNSEGKKDAKLAGASSRSLSGSGQNPIPIQAPVQNVAASSMQTPNSHPQIPVPVAIPAAVETVDPIQSQFSFSVNTPQIQVQNAHRNHHPHPQPANPTPFAAFTPITFPQLPPLPQFSFSDFTGSFAHPENQHPNQNQNVNHGKSNDNENPFAIFDDPNFPFVNPFRSSETVKRSAGSTGTQNQRQVQMSTSNANGNFGIQLQN